MSGADFSADTAGTVTDDRDATATATAGLTPPDIIRCAYAELVVTDLAASREFYVGVLGLVVTFEDARHIYLRAFEEHLHHSLVITAGPVAAMAVMAYRVRAPEDLDRAQAWFEALGCRVERRPAGATRGIGEAVRVIDPLGFPVELFHEAEQVERLTQRYDLHGAGAISRLDHFNVVVPDVPAAQRHYEGLGFRISEDIEDDEGTVYAAWMHRKPTVHDVALTGGDGPRMHHVAFATHERSQILHLCDHLGAIRQSDKIERGPGRHGVSNAFYLYLLDPDGHRIEIYTHDYWTGDPDNPVVTWDVHDNQRRDFWGSPVVPSWYRDASTVLDLDGEPVGLTERTDAREADVTVGADGFSYTRAPGGGEGKIGNQV